MGRKHEVANGTLALEIVGAELKEIGKYRCKVRVHGQRRGKTPVKHGSASPVWNHKFTLVLDDSGGEGVVIDVCKKGMIASTPISSVKMPGKLQANHETAMSLDLPQLGKLNIKYTFTKKIADPESPDECLSMLVQGVALGDQIFRLTPEHGLLHYYPAKKPEDSKPVMVTDIREVRAGPPPETRVEDDGVTFNIIHGPKYAVWTLKANSEKDRGYLMQALDLLVSEKEIQRRQLHQHDLYLMWVWTQQGGMKKGTLNLEKTGKALAGINIELSKEELKKIFDEANTVEDSGEAELDFQEFAALVRKLCQREEIQNLFKEYAADNQRMTAEEFAKFLNDVQGESMDMEKVKALIETNQFLADTPYVNQLEVEKQKEDAETANTLDIHGFLQYLESPDNDAYNPEHRLLHQDMTKPLSYYWINSSHNTYLLEDQLKGPSSVEAYIRAMRDGCRCVELDCWDGNDGDPVVFHGHTLTSKILFKDIIIAVKKHAFVASEYPLILSIENHCGLEQQVKMANYMTEILGDMLYMTPPNEEDTHLPSPEYFKRKILVKGKKPKATAPPAEGEGAEQQAQNLVEDEWDDEESEGEEMAKVEDEKKNASKKPVAKVTLAPELGAVVTHVQGVHFKSFEDSKQNQKYYQMSSFGESKTKKFATENLQEFLEYNERQLSRIYPGGGRVDSSNYDPSLAYSAGCQIVALNYQTGDQGMHILRGLFRTNGDCGYILKPSWMTTLPIAFPEEGTRKITIKVISANRLPKPALQKKGEVVDPFIKLYIEGVPDQKLEAKTKTVPVNGFNPKFNEEFTFEVPKKNWDTAHLRMAVRDEDVGSDDFLAFWCAPLVSLKKGYRHVPLYLEGGFPVLNANVFVHITL